MKTILITIIFFLSTATIFASGFQQLKSPNIPKKAFEHPVGPMDAGKQLHLVIELPMRNQSQQEQLLHDLYDPKSPDYRHFLTPQEYAERFGATQKDYDTVEDFFKNSGFKVTPSSNHLVLGIDGTVEMIEMTFHTKLKVYKHPTENREFYAPVESPSVDLDIPLTDVIGLNNYMRVHPVWGEHPPIRKVEP